ncbi:MAG TPA: HD domain-containing protein [Candidatus Saccharimonadales bacterium]|nr:HD domain-containing protein [Candidatus Saccharimonadales bacterium]
MAKPALKDIQQLLHELIVPFYEIERDMPIPVPSYRNENDAEHSWSLSLLTAVLAPEIDPSLNVGKATIFAVVHDVVEIYAGDTSVWGPSEHKATKHQREQQAITKIAENFTAFPKLHDYIDEYESKSSNEALFVYALDKFINALIRITDEGKYFRLKKIDFEQFVKGIADHQKKAHSHDAVGHYYDELLGLFYAHPEHFYQESAHD